MPNAAQGRMLLYGLVILVFVANVTLAFVAWAYSPGNAAREAAAFPEAAMVFKVLTFPLFTVLPSNLLNTFFWPALVGNAVIWSVCALLIGALLSKGRSG